MNAVRFWNLPLVCMAAVVLLVGASSVLAVAPVGPTLYEIGPVGTSTTTQGRAITPDGKYVVGYGDERGFIWDAVNLSRQVIDTGNTTAKELVGVGYRTYNPGTGDEKQLVAFGISTAGPYASYYITVEAAAAAGTEVWGPKLRRTNVNGTFPASNGLAGSSTQADAWYDVWFGTALAQVLVEKGSGAPALPQQDAKNVTTATGIQGVSSTGLAVGWRKADGVNPQGYVLQHTGGGGTSGNYYPNGLRTSPNNLQGQLWAIAAYSDGTDNRAGGMGPVDGGRTGNWPYVVDDFTGTGTGTATELPTFDSSIVGSATNGIVYGFSPDGDYAVGMDYTLGVEKAVLWDLRDPDSGNWTEMDLTQFASDHGILGSFGSLRRAYAVGINAEGQPVITGYGYTDATRGFVLTVPEPGTVALLAIGGLVLLLFRRRR